MPPNLNEKDEEALKGIIKYCDSTAFHIQKFGNTFSAFQANLAFQEACSFDAIQIGEFANRLTEDYRNSHPDIPWHEIIGLRNAVAHAYGHIDQAILWETITEDFPPLRTYCAKQIGLETV